MEWITITGGTGTIGRALREALREKGYGVVVLARDARQEQERHGGPGLSFAHWNVERGEIDKASSLARSHYLVHLAGENLAKGRWTPSKKKRIVDSRVKSGELLVRALAECNSPVKKVIVANAIGWYGPDPQIPNAHPFRESAPPANDFLGQTCRLWKEAMVPVQSQGRKLVTLRTGIVISPQGGAMEEFRKPLRLGLATVLGSGRQEVSWIHLDDIVSMYVAAITSPAMEGDFNAVAPQTVTNRELVTSYASFLRRSFLTLRVPAAFLKLALGEKSVEVLKSVTVSAEKILSTGFVFKYPRIEEAWKGMQPLT